MEGLGLLKRKGQLVATAICISLYYIVLDRIFLYYVGRVNLIK